MCEGLWGKQYLRGALSLLNAVTKCLRFAALLVIGVLCSHSRAVSGLRMLPLGHELTKALSRFWLMIVKALARALLSPVTTAAASLPW